MTSRYTCEGVRRALGRGLVVDVVGVLLGVLRDLELVVLASDVRLKVAQIGLEVCGVLIVVEKLVEIDKLGEDCVEAMQSVMNG